MRDVSTFADAVAVLRAQHLVREVRGEEDFGVSGVAHDSRRVEPGDLFVAWKGLSADGHDHARAAVEAGAVALVVERPLEVPVPQVLVTDGRLACALLAHAAAGAPGDRATLVAVTGTNGKTTTTHILRHLLGALGPSASMGTLGVVDPTGRTVPGTVDLTTPGPVRLSHELRSLVDDHEAALVTMEASSHALDQRRLDALRFDAGVFTNLSRDHLDYHESMDAYRASKLRLVDLLRESGTAVVNADDPAWADLARADASLTYGIDDRSAAVRAEALRLEGSGSSFDLVSGEDRAHVRLPLLGRFNVENALAAAAAALALGMTHQQVASRLASVAQIPGRLERVAERPAPVLIDFAHTPGALENVLATLRPLVGGRLVVLFGAGGDRDRTKRRPMAEAVARYADVIVLTSDNPRTEDPEQILDDLEVGLGDAPHARIADRRQAIRHALDDAVAGDLVLLAGKGHETYQVLGTEKVALRRARGGPRPSRRAGGRVTDALFAWTDEAIRAALALEGPPRAERSYTGILTDSRSIQGGELFVALEGERFDGHEFVAAALEAGCRGAVVSRDVSVPDGAVLYRVPDTLVALGDLARYRRLALPARVVGVTGSVGKTTTKELLAAALGSTLRVHATPGNLNNRIGLPLTLLAAPTDAEVVVAEMGTNEPGEIACLAAIARSDVAVVTTVGESHLEKLGSVEGVLEEKLDLVRSSAGAKAPRAIIVKHSMAESSPVWAITACAAGMSWPSRVRRRPRGLQSLQRPVRLPSPLPLSPGADSSDATVQLGKKSWIRNRVTSSSGPRPSMRRPDSFTNRIRPSRFAIPTKSGTRSSTCAGAIGICSHTGLLDISSVTLILPSG